MLIKLKNQYYLTSDDKINIGDWFYCSDNTNYAHIFKCIGLTDDTHLQVSSKNGYGDWDIDYSFKIVASTKKLNGVKFLKFKEICQ